MKFRPEYLLLYAVTDRSHLCGSTLPEQVEADVYTFSCTPMQIRNYFLSFGANVQILEPQSLRQDFICAYREALESYQ